MGKFAQDCVSFISALRAAGAHVRVTAVLRPRERAYLMHWAWMIVFGNTLRRGVVPVDPRKVPPMAGVDIIWWHGDDTMTEAAALAASRRAALAMKETYGMVYFAALASNHTIGQAVDMNISWRTKELQVIDANGKAVTISSGPRNGTNTQIEAIGKSFGVIHHQGNDTVHWSINGR